MFSAVAPIADILGGIAVHGSEGDVFHAIIAHYANLRQAALTALLREARFVLPKKTCKFHDFGDCFGLTDPCRANSILAVVKPPAWDPMRRSERILDEEKNSRRTIADAIDVLHKHASFGEQDQAIIRVDALPSPSYQNVAQVHVVFENLPQDVTYFVWLPSASKFKARRDGHPGHEIFAISELDGATIHSDGTVLISDHRRLRAVEVVPELLPYDLTDLEWRIIHRTIQYMGIEGRVYRSYWEGLDTRLQDGLPDQRSLDFSRLVGLDVPLLKQIRGYIEDNDTPARTPSPETIAATLKKCGMRIPASRLRRRFEPG